MADTWEVISGYSATDYVDTMTFEVDAETKKLAKLSGQTLVAGEKNSQYIQIKMPRYWDGIDISEMNIGIIYDLNNSEYFGTTQAISAERTTDSIRFGWVVPEDACAVKGTLLFVIIVKGTNYILKTQIADTPVVKSLSEDGDIPEPTKETWYADFQVRVERTLSAAENAVEEVQSTLEQARSFVGSPLVAETAAGMVDTDRIYVYTGSETGYTTGNWYYYNTGTSAWTSGGVYNAVAVDTDTTLTIAGKPADSKKTGDEISQLKEELNDIDDILYPEGKTSTNSIVVEGAELIAANNYVDLGVALTKGIKYNFTLAFSATPSNLSNVYMNTSRSGSGSVDTVTSELVGTQTKTFSYTPAVDNVKYVRIQFTSSYTGDLTIDITAEYSVLNDDAIKLLMDAVEAQKTEIELNTDLNYEEIYVDTNAPYNLIPTDCVITPQSAIQWGNGAVVSDSTRCVTDFIPIDATQGHICNCAKVLNRAYNPTSETYDTNGVNPLVLRYMAFYDGNKNFVATTSANDDLSKVIPTNAKFVRVTIATIDLVKSAMLIYGNYESIPLVRYVEHRRVPTDIDIRENTGFENFTMVMFGDSITHGDQYIGHNGVSYVDYVNDNLHSNIINVGFGGTRMSHYGASGGTAYFSFDALCDAIVSGDWTNQDSAISTETTYDLHLATLKAIDWNTVNAIGILYGANDWHSDTPVSNSFELNSGTYNGACAYGLDKLLTVYPHLQVIVFTPMFRETTLGDPATSSDVANGAGLTMADYGDSLKIVQDVFHCPVVDSGRKFGMNKYNIHLYTMDGTHPRTNMAQRRLGYLFTQAIAENISPYGVN